MSTMQWDDDEYKEMKWLLHDVIRTHLKDEHASKISIAHSSECIDRFVNMLTMV